MTTSYQPGTRVSEYLLESKLGAGSFGEVWKARHHIWESDKVAVKLPIEPQYVRYLQREGAVVHGLKHTNIVRVMGLDPYAEIPYLVMELVRGPALAGLLAENRKGLPIDAVHAVLRGVLEGLSAAHTAGVLHRDLKPGNVLVDLNGKPLNELRIEDVKLGDFGLGMHSADLMRSIAQSASIERDGKLVGTLAYMAPELRDGTGRADPRSDLYSLGVMLFEMICGERPAGAELPSSLRDCPRHLDSIYQRLYARHDRRYESAEAVLKDLATAQTGSLPPLPGAKFAGASNGQRRYRYDALDKAGTQRHGEINAASREEANEKLRQSQLFPTNLQEAPTTTATVTCRQCNRPIQPDDQFCMSCGAQLASQVRRCNACGSFPGKHDQFCIFCGQALAPGAKV